MALEAPEKKDVTASPEVKVAAPKPAFPPAGWQYYVKRGVHCLRDQDGYLSKWKTRKDAENFANGV